MTRLKQALRWWRNHVNDETPVPFRHLQVLRQHNLLTNEDEDGHVDLNEEGNLSLEYYELLP